jgi:hypothetical protein
LHDLVRSRLRQAEAIERAGDEFADLTGADQAERASSRI